MNASDPAYSMTAILSAIWFFGFIIIWLYRKFSKNGAYKWVLSQTICYFIGSFLLCVGICLVIESAGDWKIYLITFGVGLCLVGYAYQTGVERRGVREVRKKYSLTLSSGSGQLELHTNKGKTVNLLNLPRKQLNTFAVMNFSTQTPEDIFKLT